MGIERLTLKLLPDEEAAEPEGQHRGKSLNQLLDAMGPIELFYPEIEDPVEWVKAQRRKCIYSPIDKNHACCGGHDGVVSLRRRRFG